MTALNAQAIALFNTLAPGAMDFLMGQSLPFIGGVRRGMAKARPGGQAGRRESAGRE